MKNEKAKKTAPRLETTCRYAAFSLSAGLVFLVLSAGALLSNVAGGPLFDVLRSGMRGLFGMMSFIFTLLLLWLGLLFTVQAYHPVSWRGFICIFSICLLLSSAIDLFSGTGTQPFVSYITESSVLDQSALVSWMSVCGTAYKQGLTRGYGTGFAGMLLAYPLHTLLTDIPAGIVCLTGDIVLVFVLLRTNPMRVFDRLSDLMESRRQKRYEQEQKQNVQQEQEERTRFTAQAVSARRQAPVPPIYRSFVPSPAEPEQNMSDIYDVPTMQNTAADAPVPDPEDTGFIREEDLYSPEETAYKDVLRREPASVPPVSASSRRPSALSEENRETVSSVRSSASPRVPVQPPMQEPERTESKKTVPARKNPTVSEEPAMQDYYDVLPEPDAYEESFIQDAALKEDLTLQKPEKPKKTETAFASFRGNDASAKTEASKEARAEAPQTASEEESSSLSGTDSAWLELVRAKQQKASSGQSRVAAGRMASSDRPKEVNTAPVMPLTGEIIPITPRDPVLTGDPSRRGIDGHEHQLPKGIQVKMDLPVVYTAPPIDLLSPPPATAQNTQAEDQARAQCIVDTLESFKIPSEIRQIMHGPAITQFAIQIGAGIKVSSVIGVQDNIGLQMGTNRVRVEAPIQGTNYIGIEVPNLKVRPVTLREVLESDAMKETQNAMTVALGKNIAGTPILCDLSKMPHLLIAGATGSGKSVCINSIVCSLIYRASPQEVRLIMVDPKQVELQTYNGIPHLLVPVISDPKKAAAVLNWVVNEMFDRYHKFSEHKTRNIAGYNKLMEGTGDTMPNIVVIIDEMADLMEVCRKDVEESIRRLAALARAAGIYMVLATQRPSVDVITGVIKNNIPSRIAFAVSSAIDSRTILDMGGAEKLVGKGDMLYKPTGQVPLRVQGCFLSDDEVNSITDYVSSRYETNYDPNIQEELDHANDHDSDEEEADDVPVSSGDSQSFDDLLEEAIMMAIEDEQISTSMLQRRLRVGYARAGRLIDEMEKRGIISRSEGSKPRKTLVSREEYLRMVKESEE